MRTRSENARARTGRLGGAVLLAISLIVGSAAPSSARPSQHDLQVAKDKLTALNRQLDLLVEEYNQARLELDKTQRELGDARQAAARAKAESEAARELLSARAAAAYESSGSEIQAILSASTLSDFSDRIEFMSNLAQQNADVATQADIKRQEAIRAQSRLDTAIARQNSLLRSIADKTSAIKSGIAEAQGLVKQIEVELAKPIPKPKPAAQPTVKAPPTSNPIHHKPGGTGGGPPPTPDPPTPDPPPPPPSGGAAAAVAAAYSVIGTPYQWGGSDPETGFDCSGLTMWSWAQAGVSLPHSSAAQYAILPHLSRTQLQPGDLVFFYSPISHVGMYVGGGMMIHSPHTGGFVEKVSFDNYPDFVGAGRPG
jgi:peptidoglycan DL-endopeptidase CwlO